MYKKITHVLLGLSACLFLGSCTEDKVPIKFDRFEQSIFTNTNIDSLEAQYTVFFPFFLNNIIQVKNENDSITSLGFEAFINEYKNNLYDSVQNVFPNMKPFEEALSLAFGRYKKNFPKAQIPQLYTHISGFNKSVISVGNIISVSLDDYLGESSYYERLGIFKYLRIEMYPKQIPLDIMQVIALRKIATKGATQNLLSTMIYHGKIIYFLEQVFPEYDMSTLLNYTKEQEQWCANNEAMMWRHIIENKHLFASNYRTIRAYIDNAPFTRGFPQESPARTGAWIGYHIVKKYAENSKDSLSEILKNTDYKKILQDSAYNPN